MEAACLTRSYAPETLQIVEDVFMSMLRMDVWGIDDPGAPTEQVIIATVHFVGSWKGALSIECTTGQTFEFTRRLLGVDPPAEVNEDVCDSFGELANMIGGNLKAVLPPSVQLSMPSVVRGVDYAMRICHAVTACRLAFQCELGVFWVTLVEFVEP
jgi:CheY-specific phosphatase CheX